VKTIIRVHIFSRETQTILRLPLILGLAAWIFVHAGNSSLAQTSSEETLKVDVNLVTVGVRATDSAGRVIPGLCSQDFRLLEDGHPHPLSFFSAEKQPISLVMLVDTSFSMGGEGNKMDFVKKAALSLVESIHPESELQYYTFHHEVNRKVDFTTDRDLIKSAISNTVVDPGGTSFYDALIQALGQLHRARFPRQAVVLFTDGVDQHSRHTLEEVVKAVQGTQAEVFMIGLFSSKDDEDFRQSGKTVSLISGRAVDNPQFSFAQLAEESGARCFFPQSETDLPLVVDAISKDLESQYTLAYYAQNTANDDHFRLIEVKSTQRGIKIRSRRGYRLHGGAGEAELMGMLKTAVTKEPSGSPQKTYLYESKLEKKNGRIVYREDFSNLDTGWPKTKEMFCDQGHYSMTLEKTYTPPIPYPDRTGFPINSRRIDRRESLEVSNGPSLANFRCSLTVNFHSRGNRGLSETPSTVIPAAGMVFRLNERGYYAYLLTWYPNSKDTFLRLVRKNVDSSTLIDIVPWTKLTEESQRADRSLPGKIIAVTCLGSQLALFLNGEPVVEVFDNTFAVGMVGMALVGEGSAIFDDLLLEELP
jgi:VWFA-related protein